MSTIDFQESYVFLVLSEAGGLVRTDAANDEIIRSDRKMVSFSFCNFWRITIE
jgi:hypothetical protein